MAKKIQTHTFFDGTNSDLADEVIKPSQSRRILNCNVVSTAEGNIGIVTNVKGNIAIEVDLPAGRNKTIGVAVDEEVNKFYFAVWNSEGYHTWYTFDAVSETVSIMMQCRRDTNDVDIFKWKESDVILHTVIKENNLLYWAMKGHPARKINIEKATQKDSSGYGTVILEEYTRAYKKTAEFPPECRYVTDENVKSNHVYRNLFKFAVRFIYDDGEKSVFSDYSMVPIPDEENTNGTLGVPLTNNCIIVSFLTGGMIVKKIEIAMQRTDQETGGSTAFSSIVVLDKDILDIPDNSEYEYRFYNDNTYLPLDDTDAVIMPHLYFPRNPECLAEAGNTLAYANFEEGFPTVPIDVAYEVEYEDLFIPDSTQNQLNDPFITVNTIDNWYESGGFAQAGYRHTTGEVVIGNDVKRGNIFTVRIMNGSTVDSTFSYEATLTDTASTVANALANKFRTHGRMQGSVGSKSGWVDRVVVDGSGAKFRFDIWNRRGADLYHTFTWNVNPVNYSTLKNTGNSVLTNKLGSARRYGIVYRDKNQMKSLSYGNIEAVYIKPLNELGGLKKAIIKLIIKHRAPDWATSYEITSTKNLVQEDYIQILVQNKATVTTILGDTYTDLVIGSLNTYNKIHPNSTLRYEFKKGDRVRLLRLWDVATSTWSYPTDVIDYEVLDYLDITTTTVNKNVTLNSTNIAEVDSPDVNDIGSFIRVNGSEREITGVSTSPVGYQLSSPFSSNRDGGTEHTYPSFEIINSRGVLRIKLNPDYPIDIVAEQKFGLIEVYTPAQTLANSENENYYSLGLSFPITQQNGLYLHSGNIQNQTETQDAIVQIEGYDNYVRNRELPISNNVQNPQVIFSSVEDSSFSDFYVSDLSSLGKTSRLDNSVGVVKFGSRIRYSLPFIEDTRINGFSFFKNLNRADYNDQYGDISRLVSDEGKLYVFKHLKYCWVPIYGRVITDNNNIDIIATSTKVLPDKLEYFLFSAGIGDNPESVVRYGNEIFSVSPNSGYIISIGGNGAIPISKQFGMDKDIRDIIANASKSGAKMFGAFDRKNGYYIVNVEGYDIIVFNAKITNENHAIIPIEDSGVYEILSGPFNGTIEITPTGYNYYPNNNFSGEDYITYRSVGGETRKDVFDVLAVETATAWRGVGLYCIVESGSRTGDAAYSTLEQYDTITGLSTGVTKPNSPSDPDYIDSFEDLLTCPIGAEYVNIAKVNRRLNSQTIRFDFVSDSDLNIIIKQGADFGSPTLAETGIVSSGTHNLSITSNNSDCYIFVVVDGYDYSQITTFKITGAYISTANFNDLTGLIDLSLDQSSIPVSHNNNFSSLTVNQCALLESIEVINHSIVTQDLTNNDLLKYIDFSGGRVMTGLNIGDWSNIETLIVHNSLFTSDGYNPTFVNNIITYMNDISVNPVLLKYGANNSSGVRPSLSMSSKYNSLITKASVIGRNPTVTSVNLTISYTHVGKFIDTVLTLSAPLPVDIFVEIIGSFNDNFGTPIAFNETYTLFAGQLTENYVFEWETTVSDVFLSIRDVTPNPAGGITINY